ncbi:MAG: hypothetical protein HLUCCA01_12300 [Bacteroidetes bacterium HLUCCA01]|nr:MAG: hypothetical protein HLUCCA01_12300 [Bacteroidetes bacterium HLUCCA01]
MQRIITSLLLLFAVTTTVAFAQNQEIRLDNNAMIWVDGTSTLHDWTVESARAAGIIVITNDAISSVSVQVDANSLESGKSGMDRRMYDALDVRGNNQIRFESSSITLNDDLRSGVATGQLTIAGQTRDHEVPFELENDGSDWKFTGQTALLMTTFDIDPPTAVMGTVRTGDEVVIRFEINSSQPLFVNAQ